MKIVEGNNYEQDIECTSMLFSIQNRNIESIIKYIYNIELI